MYASFLAQLPLFAPLPAEEVEQIAAVLHRLALPPQVTLFQEGESGDRAYVILEGQVEIIKEAGTPDERLLSVCEPGEFIGEMSLLNPDEPRVATVRTRTAARLLCLDRVEFEGLLRQHPSLAYEMARRLSMRLRESDNAIIHDLRQKNRELTQAYEALKAAHVQIVEKEKLEHELALAREIQDSMLPSSLPEVAGFDFGVRLLPARAVGGDLFDFIPLDHDTLGVVVADVCDKGVPAAMFMALSRSLLRAEASRAPSPRDALLQVNRHLLDMNEASMFVTVLYGVLRLSTREFTYVRAGHERPILFDAHGAANPVSQGQGQPLALLPDPTLEEHTLILPPGSGLLLYSDGVTDAVNPDGKGLGLAGLQAAIRAHAHLAAQPLCDHLLQALQDYQGSAAQYDDVTLVAVRARP